MSRRRPWRPSARVYESGQMVTLTLDVTIDWDAIAQQLGKAAARNKTGKTGMLHGAIKATIIGRSTK